MKKIHYLLLLCVVFCILGSRELLAQTFPAYGIIHNTTVTANQVLALGVNPQGNLNTPKGSGTVANNANTLNAGGSVGTAYKWAGGKPAVGNGTNYPAGWYDATSPGKMWEGWGASAIDSRNVATYGFASIDSGGVSNVTVKSFVVDNTSIKSTVWINDSSGSPMLEVTHVYGPTIGATNNNLFQGLVTITNISGGTLRDVRYRRAMDWDILDNLTGVYIDHSGVAASYSSANYPKVWNSCDNGGSWFSDSPNPVNACQPATTPSTNSVDVDFVGIGPGNLGSSFTFQFGDIICNESAIFYIYYGGGSSRAVVSNALTTVGASVYSLGYDPAYPTVAYGFGFRGVSGSAIAPTLPTKTASLPAGSFTDPTVYQTYAPPVLTSSNAYQALFQYQKDKQWIGEIRRYNLDVTGAITSAAPLTAKSLLQARAAVSGSYSTGGRSIWSVGYDPACMSSGLSNDAVNNSFNLSNSSNLTSLLFNCPASPSVTATNDLINFARGLNSYWEESSSLTSVRSSVLGDTYHSEMIFVGPPNAPWSTDIATFGKTEAYYRSTQNYSGFITANAARRSQIYVGANDGMLHAFDLDLNERWAFIPPSVLPLLRNMTGVKGATAGTGTSNSIFSVDGPITVKDVYFYGEAKWKTVLMGGLGWGGNSYFALDITNPDVPVHLFTINNDTSNKVIQYWNADGTKSEFAYSAGCTSFDYSKLGGAWSRPAIMLLPYIEGSTNQRWVAVFGAGYAGGTSTTSNSSASSYGSYVYALELEPDSSKSTASCGATGNSVVTSTGGHVLEVTAVGNDAASDIPNGVTAHLTIITGDGTSLANYYGGIAYFTDLQGKLWKYDLSKVNLSDPNSGLFTLYQGFKTQATLANDRMGYNQLASTVVTGPNALGATVNRVFNYFGTGDLTRIQRRVSTINNRIYGSADPDFPATTISQPNLTVSSYTNVDTQQCNVNNSWYANVYARTNVSPASDYQKVIGRAAVFNKSIYFSVYQPENKSCPLYGTSRIIEMASNCTASGSGALQYTTNSDGSLSPPTYSGLATAPVMDAKGNIYVGLSNVPAGGANLVKAPTTPAVSGNVQYKSWREKRVY